MAGSNKLAYFVTVDTENGERHTFGPDDTVPAWAVKAITNPSAWADGEGPGEDEGGDKPYAKWLKADLEAEVERRNEGREDDDLIVVGGTGKVSDLAEALEADDDSQ